MALKETYTTRELAGLFGFSTMRSVFLRADREHWKARERAGRGGGKEWLLVSMPEETRVAIRAAEEKQTLAIRPVPTPFPALSPTTTTTAIMDDKRRYKALARADLVCQYLTWQRRHGATKVQKAEFKGFRGNPGKDWLDGLDLKKYPNLNKKSYEEQRGPASKRPAPVTTYAELEDGIKSRCGHFATNNGILSVDFLKDPTCFMATWCNGRFKVSTHTHSVGKSKTFNAAGELKNAWNKLAEGKPLTWEEEYACESLWHEITHNRQKNVLLGRNTAASRYMETVTQWTARRTYHEMLESLGGKAAHQTDIKKNGLGYGYWIRNFDRLLDVLGVDDSVMLPFMQEIITTLPMDKYGKALVDFLSKESGVKKSAVRAALSGTKEWDYEKVLRDATLIQ